MPSCRRDWETIYASEGPAWIFRLPNHTQPSQENPGMVTMQDNTRRQKKFRAMRINETDLRSCKEESARSDYWWHNGDRVAEATLFVKEGGLRIHTGSRQKESTRQGQSNRLATLRR